MGWQNAVLALHLFHLEDIIWKNIFGTIRVAEKSFKILEKAQKNGECWTKQCSVQHRTFNSTFIIFRNV